MNIGTPRRCLCGADMCVVDSKLSGGPTGHRNRALWGCPYCERTVSTYEHEDRIGAWWSSDLRMELLGDSLGGASA